MCSEKQREERKRRSLQTVVSRPLGISESSLNELQKGKEKEITTENSVWIPVTKFKLV
jgi:hypothetical protein